MKLIEQRLFKAQTPSSSIFEALKSLYMTFFSEVCRKASPRAAPIAIWSLLSQDSGSTEGFPATQKSLSLSHHSVNKINLQTSIIVYIYHLLLILLKRWFSKLPFCMNSYTRSSSLSSQQYPRSFTRLG